MVVNVLGCWICIGALVYSVLGVIYLYIYKCILCIFRLEWSFIVILVYLVNGVIFKKYYVVD